MKSLAKYLVPVSLLVGVTVYAQEGGKGGDKVSARDMSNGVAAIDKQIRADAQHIAHLQAVARKEKDVVKLTCVNDKIVELKAQRNLYDTGRAGFDAAIQSNADAARPHFVEIGNAAEAVKKLRGEAEACIGVPELYKQEGKVEVTHPVFPDDPTTDDPFVPDFEAPVYASPFA